MSALEQLTMQDFGRPLDHNLFAQWKNLKRAQTRLAIMTMVFWLAGLIGLMLLGGLIGLIIFFGLSIAGILSTIPNRSKVAACQRQLGITNDEIRQALQRGKSK